VLVNEDQFRESPLLTVRAAEVAGVVVVAVEGEIDVDTADVVLDALRLGFESGGPAVVADLTATDALVSRVRVRRRGTARRARKLAAGLLRRAERWVGAGELEADRL